MKDYHSVLNVSRNAGPDEIKKAYRSMAMKYHPDKSKSKTDEKFREINEAYEALINKVPNNGTSEKDLSRDRAPARARKGTDIFINLIITAEEIAKQTVKTIEINRIVPCGVCLGTGSGTSKPFIKCHKCNGSGVDVVSSLMGSKKFCEDCKGYGTIQQDRGCRSCGGNGLLTIKTKKDIKLNRKFTLEQIVFLGEGHYSIGCGIPGNLILKPILEKKCPYEVVGKNIRGKLTLSPAQAVLGDIVYLDVFGDIVKVTAEPGTKTGSLIEIKDKGVQKGRSKGSLILKVVIEIPQKINEEEKKLYTRLLEIQKNIF
jgi:molecular chaperone DnaJ